MDQLRRRIAEEKRREREREWPIGKEEKQQKAK